MAETIDDTKTFTIELTAEPGEGRIVNQNYPASVKHGAAFDVNASTENIGDGSGTFVMELHIDGTLESRSAEFTLAAGATSTDKIPEATAPAVGESMSIDVKCIRIT
jgi:uncharacterized protein YfaS (alpha-2-macroglobulin family)